MRFFNFKKIFSGSFFKKTDAKDRFKINPARDWLVLCLSFSVSFIVLILGLFYIKAMVIDKSPSFSVSESMSFKLDQNKLNSILSDRDQKITENQKLQTQAPTVVDPGK